MQIVETQIHEEGGAKPCYRVDFCGDGGERISVMIKKIDDEALTRGEAIEKARMLMLEVASLEARTDPADPIQATR